MSALEAGLREVMAQAQVGAQEGTSRAQAHERIVIDFAGVDAIDVAIDGWRWMVRVSRPRWGHG